MIYTIHRFDGPHRNITRTKLYSMNVIAPNRDAIVSELGAKISGFVDQLACGIYAIEETPHVELANLARVVEAFDRVQASLTP